MKNLMVILWCVCPISALAQIPVRVDVDHAAFVYDEQEALVEVYLAFGASSLDYVVKGEEAGGYVSRLPMTMRLLRATDLEVEGEEPAAAVWEYESTLEFAVADISALGEGQFFVRQVRLTAPPGEYELRILIRMDNGVGEFEIRRDMIVSDYVAEGRSGMSDVTLATKIERGEDKDHAFYKNGLVIHPNANQLYGEGLSRLFYYAEAYNVQSIVPEEEEYEFMAYIAEANRPQPIPALQKRSRRKVRTPDVLVGSFSLRTLSTGSYFLRLVVLDAKNEARLERSRKFFVFNPSVVSEPVVSLGSSFEMSLYANMQEEEVTAELEHIRVIATDGEWRRGRRIKDLDEKRRFLMEFWEVRDPDVSTPANEFREDFRVLLQYANERYSLRGMEGWETDRGRTLIKYGSPSEIEPHLYDRGFKPYEVWQYNNISGEGEAIFVFVDRDGFGDFELIHSTVAGERRLANWQTEIREGY